MAQQDSTKIASLFSSKSLIVPIATTFMASFCVMVLELVASRLIARYLGSSLYTWTAVIGVVLAGIALGNFIGGRLADRFNVAKSLSILFILGAIGCLTTIPMNRIVGTMGFLQEFPIPLRVFVHITVVFLMPSVLLGMISPLIAKMALDKGNKTGNTIGDIYAWGAAGSIAGTFFTGYFLLGAFGSIAIICGVGAGLLTLGLIYIVFHKQLAVNHAEESKKIKVKSESTASEFRMMLGFGLTVFLSSACIMALEMVASRMVARQLGSSLYTWTSIIGVVLTGVTLGSFLGGKLADRFPTRKVVAYLLTLSSIACLFVIVINDVIGLNQWEAMFYLSWPVRVLLHISMIYLLPSILLGAVGPVVAKMALEKMEKVGSTVGAIYAWGTVGSIVGTFLTGYVLIATIGTTALVWMIGTILILVALYYQHKQLMLRVWMCIFVVAMCLGCLPESTLGQSTYDIAVKLSLRQPTHPGVIYEDETPYCYVAVKRIALDPEMRSFHQDKLVHSHMVVNDITQLQYAYEQIHGAITHRFAGDKEKLSTLIIGGGGYIFPRYIEETWPGSHIDVAEIDPGVTEAAFEGFGLPRDTPIRIHTMDARNYIDSLVRKQSRNEEIVKYDFIYEDALNDYSVPFQLTTKEFNDKIARIMTDDGIYMIEMIDVYDSGQLLSAFVNTLEESFTHVEVIDEIGPDSVRKTFVVVASQQKLDLQDLHLEKTATELKLRVFKEDDIVSLRAKTNGLILTDDFAPVDNLLTAVVRRSAIDLLAQKYTDEALEFYEAKDYTNSLKRYRKLYEIHEDLQGFFALEKIGVILAEQGRLDESIHAFKEAIKFNENAMIKSDESNTFKCLGIVYMRKGNAPEAAKSLKKAVGGFEQLAKDQPKSVKTFENLGGSCVAMAEVSDALGAKKDVNEAWKIAALAYDSASQLDPANTPYHVESVKALLNLGKFDTALKRLDNAIVVTQAHNLPENATALKQFRTMILEELR